MELKIYSPAEGTFLQEISFNFIELKAELEASLKKYEGLVYSDKNIREAKADRANLNKFKDALEARRKEIKKQVLTPYESFEAQVKDLVAMVDKPILAIDAQVKNYEQIIKDEKLEGIKSFYADRVGGLESLVSFDRINNPRWLNVTYKEADIHKEIIDLFIKVESDLQVIAELQSEYDLQIKDTYLKNFELTAALQEKKRLEEQAAKMAEYKRIQAEKQAQAKKDKQEREAPRIQEKEQAAPKPPSPPQPEPEQAEKTYQMDFRVWGTKEQIIGIRQYLQDSGIKYGNVPKPE